LHSKQCFHSLVFQIFETRTSWTDPFFLLHCYPQQNHAQNCSRQKIQECEFIPIFPLALLIKYDTSHHSSLWFVKENFQIQQKYVNGFTMMINYTMIMAASIIEKTKQTRRKLLWISQNRINRKHEIHCLEGKVPDRGMDRKFQVSLWPVHNDLK